MKKRTGKILLIFLVFILIFSWIIFFNFGMQDKEIICGDGTFEGKCSMNKPYFCLNKTLIERAFVCGCPENLVREGDYCISKYQTNPKNVTLRYILRGEEGKIDFVVYKGMVDYISQLPKFIDYSDGEKPLRQDFKFKKINEKEQEKLLLPLVVEIQNVAENKNDQVRIAVSIAQKIFYGESTNNITIGSKQINYSRYAYEVVYGKKGACEGKSELLAFLLKKMGYGVVLFYFPLEDHEAVGIKCPGRYSSYNSGYCFVETTGSSIISNDQEYYSEWGKLLSDPEIIFISDGKSLPEDLYEYKDAKDFIELSKIIEETGELNIFRDYIWKSLKEKYGLRHL